MQETFIRRYGVYNVLEKEYSLFGVVLFKKIIEQERIPNWAYYQYCCLGDTEWKSELIMKKNQPNINIS